MLPSGFIRAILLAAFSANQRSPPGEDGQRPEWNRLWRAWACIRTASFIARPGKMPTCCQRWKKGYGVVDELVRWPPTPSRRLQLAAEASGGVAFALRRSGSASDEANAASRARAFPPHRPGRRSIWTWDLTAGALIFCAAGGGSQQLYCGGLPCDGSSRCPCRAGRPIACGAGMAACHSLRWQSAGDRLDR